VYDTRPHAQTTPYITDFIGVLGGIPAPTRVYFIMAVGVIVDNHYLNTIRVRNKK